MTTQRAGGRPIICAATRYGSGSGRPLYVSSAATTASNLDANPRLSKAGLSLASGVEVASAAGTFVASKQV